MSLINASDNNIPMQVMRSARTLDRGIAPFEEAPSRLQVMDPVALYYAGIVENRLLTKFIERQLDKPSLPAWWNFWIAKKNVKKELKSLDFPVEYLKLPKRAELSEKTYSYKTIEELVLLSRENTVAAEAPAIEEVVEQELTVDNVDVDLDDSDITNELSTDFDDTALNKPEIPENAEDTRFTDEQLAQLARLLEENAVLREQLQVVNQQLAELVEEKESRDAEISASEGGEGIEESSTATDEELEVPDTDIETGERVDGDEQEQEPVTDEQLPSTIDKSIRTGRAAMPTWDDIISDVISEDHLVTEDTVAEQDEEFEEVSNDQDESADSVAEETEATETTSLDNSELRDTEPEDHALTGLMEPPEDGFLYEDALVDPINENPFDEDEEAEPAELGRQIVVEKLVVQQQVTEQSSVMGQQQVSVDPTLTPQAPVVPADAMQQTEEVNPAPPAFPQRPSLQEFRPSSTPAPVEEPAQKPTAAEPEAKEFSPAPVEPVQPVEDSVAPVEPVQPVEDSVAPVEPVQPVEPEDAVKEYQPAPANEYPEETNREKQTLHADMDVTADSVNITTKSGDPLADFDPSRYLNLANAMNKAKEEEEEVEEELDNPNDSASEDNTSFYLEEPAEPLSDTAKVNAMLKELKQLRASGKGGLY